MSSTVSVLDSFYSSDSIVSHTSARDVLSNTTVNSITSLIDELINSFNSPLDTMDSGSIERTNTNNKIMTDNIASDSNPITRLIAGLEDAVFRLLKVAEEISAETEDYHDQLCRAIRNVKHSTVKLKDTVHSSTELFPSQTEISNSDLSNISKSKPLSIAETCRGLLLNIVALLTVADCIDCRQKENTTTPLTKWLEELRRVVSVRELYDKIKEYTHNMAQFIIMAQLQQEELGNLRIYL